MQHILQQKKRQVDKRALTSLFMFFSLVWLLPSGITMHFAALSSSELLQHIVMSMHNTAATIFVFSVVVHLTLNWKSVTRYLSSKINEVLTFRTELIIATGVVTLLILLVGSHALHV